MYRAFAVLLDQRHAQDRISNMCLQAHEEKTDQNVRDYLVVSGNTQQVKQRTRKIVMCGSNEADHLAAYGTLKSHEFCCVDHMKHHESLCSLSIRYLVGLVPLIYHI